MARNNSEKRGLEDNDLATIASVVPAWGSLSDEQQNRLVEFTDQLLRTKTWEAARDFETTQRMRVFVAAQAALLILELDLDSYRDVRSIIMHPTRMVRDRVSAGPARGVVTSGPMTILGEAGHGTGPVVIAWDSLLHETQNPQRGINVVFHEFAHKLDMLDGVLDGTPPIADEEVLARWVEVCTAAFERVKQGAGVLRSYAATNPGEFFAVASETFFTTPRVLTEGEPELYDMLRSYYRQHPAERLGT